MLRTTSEQPLFVTTGTFSRLSGLSPATVKRLCDLGEIAHVVVSPRGDRRIPRSELRRLLDEAEAKRGRNHG